MNNSPLCILPEEVKKMMYKYYVNGEKIREIRIRSEENILVSTDKREICTDYVADCTTINEIMEYATGHSMYAYEEALKNGYLTICGGHRIGIAGQAVIENGRIKTVKNISSINIRFAHEIKGCADEVMKYIIRDDVICNTLIISPPGYGKTTLLRDVLRQASGKIINNHRINVSVIDERSEIASSYKGIPQNDLGPCTDVLDGCYKSEGMMMMLRTMTPDIIGVDELGLESDINALKYIVNCGCHIFATIHGESLNDVRKRNIIRDIFDNKLFSCYIILGGKGGKIKSVYNGDFQLIC